MFGLLDYFDWPHCGLHSPRTERMMENTPSTPSAKSVKRKKKLPGLTMLNVPAPLKCMTGMLTAAIPTMRVVMYPDRRSVSSSVPYSKTAAAG